MESTLTAQAYRRRLLQTIHLHCAKSFGTSLCNPQCQRRSCLTPKPEIAAVTTASEQRVKLILPKKVWCVRSYARGETRE